MKLYLVFNMLFAEMPRQFDVDVPLPDTSEPPDPSLLRATFFNESSNLRETLELAYDRAGEPDQLHVYSVGCGNGTEPVGTAAIFNHLPMSMVGNLMLLGFDTNPKAIEEARKGEYLLPFNYYDTDEMELALDSLRAYGFRVRTTPAKLARPGLYGGYGYKLGVEEILAPHDYGYFVHDLSHDAPERALGQGDLVHVCNLLVHHDPDTALSILRHSAQMVRFSGVLNLGSEDEFSAQLPMGDIDTEGDNPVFRTWLLDVALPTLADFELRPANPEFETDPSAPAIFTRY